MEPGAPVLWEIRLAVPSTSIEPMARSEEKPYLCVLARILNIHGFPTTLNSEITHEDNPMVILPLFKTKRYRSPASQFPSHPLGLLSQMTLPSFSLIPLPVFRTHPVSPLNSLSAANKTLYTFNNFLELCLLVHL